MLLHAPKVSERLLAEDDRTREATLTLLGRLFASPKEDYASSYPGIYQEWLRRFHDKCSEVRCAMVRVSLRVAAAKPQLRAALIEQCSERLQDKDWEVRRAATRSLADAMLDTAPSGLKDRIWRQGLGHCAVSRCGGSRKIKDRRSGRSA